MKAEGHQQVALFVLPQGGEGEVGDGHDQGVRPLPVGRRD